MLHILRTAEQIPGKWVLLPAGHFVSRLQIIHGIPFSYQPPPRTIVPHAAGLKGQGTRYGGIQKSGQWKQGCMYLLNFPQQSNL